MINSKKGTRPLSEILKIVKKVEKSMTNSNWEKMFDSKFADTQFGPSYHTHYFSEAGIYPKVKDFIRQLLSQSYQQGFNEALKRVEEVSSRPIVRRYSIDNLSILGRRWDAIKLLSGEVTRENHQKWLDVLERFMDCHRPSDWDSKTLSELADRIQEFESIAYPEPKQKLSALKLEVKEEK